MVTELIGIPDVSHQLGSAVENLVGDLLVELSAKQQRNRMRADYYDMHNLFRDLGIALPPHLGRLNVAMGWPAKAVDHLARRVRMDSFVLPGDDVSNWGIPELWAANRMQIEAPQAHISALIHTPAYVLTTLGDPDLGEPSVMISTHDATNAIGRWSPSRRGLEVALVVMDRDVDGPSRVLLVTPEWAADIRRTSRGAFGRFLWESQTFQHGLGRVPMEPLTYRSRLGRPFGSSRISRSVMALTDSAMRTIARAEVGAEFYSAPQRWIMGAEEKDFVDASGARKSTWDLVMGRILAIPENGAGENPEVGQFPQISMGPHNDQLRMWSQMFASETDLPVSSLGIIQDNPSSAEALYAAERDLVEVAKATCDEFGHGWVNAMRTAIQLRDGVLPAELARLNVRWRDPSLPSKAASADAVMKQISVGVLPAESSVALEQLGYDETTIQRIQSDRRRANMSATLAALTQAADEPDIA